MTERLNLSISSFDVAMEMHNPLSAIVAQEAGFPALWASGLTFASAMGCRDRNEVSWTQSLHNLIDVVQVARRPILFDCDSGHGDFNNFRHVVRRIEQIGVSGVVLEDKLFPKSNSFVEGDQTLVSVREQVGKLRAGLDARKSEHFLIVARNETMISGGTVAESLDRCHAYVEAGADAVFIHSKRRDPEQIFDFLSQWKRRAPVVIAPTTYDDVHFDEFAHAGVNLVLCANHSLRASVRAMEQVCQQILQTRRLSAVREMVCSMDGLFSMLDYQKLAQDELHYG
ncbi:isocitrate lyase/phosphoenolpyruvate mutase family protein [Roseateles depolymerans]|uniref:PEP mutase n=1 Tax=Roseateles depolymerans TaxID=76731 RepID=A0A0U3LAW3_9BURK|nr:isocitrate lyase/phosphoenolpyruvate mutase family protein [Roseateles depolymerans]ALV05183.1 PEP mutase [Roseateles depolymerans]REG14801.1 phosphoenolpyruvate phosphomutase [Roseateles depolymerans]